MRKPVLEVLAVHEEFFIKTPHFFENGFGVMRRRRDGIDAVDFVGSR